MLIPQLLSLRMHPPTTDWSLESSFKTLDVCKASIIFDILIHSTLSSWHQCVHPSLGSVKKVKERKLVETSLEVFG